MITPDQLRKCAVCVYLAAEAGPADDISNHLRQAADAIETLRAQLQALVAEREGLWEVLSKLPYPLSVWALRQAQALLTRPTPDNNNPADAPDACYACLGAPGVSHTCFGKSEVEKE